MELLVDIGNSRFKWAVHDGPGLSRVGEAVHSRGVIPSHADCAWSALEPPNRVVACSVARDDRVTEFENWCQEHWGLTPEFLRSVREAYGVVSAYPEPAQLGADRWAVLIAARAEGDRNACIIDCGTAITVDVLAAGGLHMGGMIAPGLTLMRRGLFRDTRNIGDTSEGDPPLPPGMLAANTAHAVLSGTLHAAAGLLDRAVSRIRSRYDDVELVITGGDAQRLVPHLADTYRQEPLMVLKGLAVMAGGRP